jgi:hypothetical protein
MTNQEDRLRAEASRRELEQGLAWMLLGVIILAALGLW